MKKAPGSSSDGSIGVSNDGQSNDSSARPLALFFFSFHRGPPALADFRLCQETQGRSKVKLVFAACCTHAAREQIRLRNTAAQSAEDKVPPPAAPAAPLNLTSCRKNMKKPGVRPKHSQSDESRISVSTSAERL